MCMSGLVLYSEIIIRSGRPRHRGSARGSYNQSTIVAGSRPARELQYKSSWSLDSSMVGYRLLSVCTN